MSPHKDVTFPTLTPSQKRRLTGKRQEGEGADDVTIQISAVRKVSKAATGSSHMFVSMAKKPQLLVHLESYVNKELHSVTPQEKKHQELRLQVYREVFDCFIKEFKTYQPILSDIRKEYENTLAYQQDQILALEPLRSHLRLVREECERKIQARCVEEQAEIGDLKWEREQLQMDIEAMREKEKAMQAVVERMQYELSNQYLQYREERDSRKLLIGQLSDLTSASVKEEPHADENTEEAKDPVELQLALKVCREDLTKALEEVTRMKAEYWDVVPKHNWDTMQQTHKNTLLQLKTLQGDFIQLKSEYDTLIELHKRGNMKAETLDSTTVKLAESDVPALPAASDQSQETAELNDFPTSN